MASAELDELIVADAEALRAWLSADHATSPGVWLAERIAVPTTVLWPEHDPLFPTGWSDRLDQFFADVRLQHVDSGHFLPLECPREFAAAVAAAAATTPA